MRSRFASLARVVMPLLLLTPIVALAQASPAAGASAASGFLTGIQQQVADSTAGWMSTALGLAKHLFVGLAGLEIAWTGINWVLKKNDVSELIGSFTLKMLSLLFFYMLLLEAPSWMPTIMSSFRDAGQAIASGGGAASYPMDPSSVFGEGFAVAQEMWKALATVAEANGLTGVGNTIVAAFSTVAGSLLIMVAYGLLALQLLTTNIESYVIIGAGALLLGFNGSRWTQVFAEKYFGYAFSVGVKLMVLYLIAGLGVSLEQKWVQLLAANNSSSTFTALLPLQIGVGGLVYGVMSMTVPGLAGSMLNGSPSLNAGNFMAAGVAGAAAGVGTAMAAGGAAVAAGAAGVAGLRRLAGLVGGAAGGVAGGGGDGAVGGTQRLAKLAGAMSPGTAPAGGSGMGGPAPQGSLQTNDPAEMAAKAGTAAGQDGAAERKPVAGESGGSADAAKVEAKGSTDALGGGGEAGGEKGRASLARHGVGAAQQGLEHLGNARDGVARHEGSAGGISIRLGHAE